MIVDGKDYIVVVIICFEIMFGDMVVVVNFKDECYFNLIGKSIMLLLVNCEIFIVVDDYVEMEFGIGCVKIMSVYDFNDYEVGKWYNLLLVNIFSVDVVILEFVEVFNFDGSENMVVDRVLL